jgi:hypothetical protein
MAISPNIARLALLQGHRLQNRTAFAAFQYKATADRARRSPLGVCSRENFDPLCHRVTAALGSGLSRGSPAAPPSKQAT